MSYLDSTRRSATAGGELAPADQLLLQLLSKSADHVMVVDQDLRIVWSSPNRTWLLSEPPVRSLLELVYPDDLPSFIGGFRRALQAPGSMELVSYRLWQHGKEPAAVQSVFRDCRDDPSIGGILVTTRDVTEQARNERSLRRSARGLQAIIEELPVGIVLLQKGRVALVNRALEALAATPRADLIGLDPLQVIAVEDHARWQTLVAATGSGEKSALQELRVVRRDGHLAVAESSALSIGFDGEPATLVFFSDVTERRALRARLAFSDRMAAIGTLAAGVAHEVNNPLAFMTMNLAFIDEELEKLGKEHDFGPAFADVLSALRDARAGCSRVRQVVRDLRTFSRADEQTRTRVDVAQVLESCLSMMRTEIRHRAQLMKTIEAVPQLQANHAQLAQVFFNLLLNAAQAIPEGDAAHHEITVRLREQDGKILFTVGDTGSGISPENFPRIFDPFFTTKPVGTGTGLGLSICHNIVSGLGGQIHVETREGRGSTFTVELPVLSNASDVEQPAPSVPRQRSTLLIVDDDESVGLSLMRALRDVHEISYAEGGRRALAMLREGQRFDAVLCDELMPEMSGNEFFELLLTELPDQAQRVIFMIAGDSSVKAASPLHHQARWHLEKPFSFEQVEGIIAEMLVARAGLRERPVSTPALRAV